jgi:hypothetical protein
VILDRFVIVRRRLIESDFCQPQFFMVGMGKAVYQIIKISIWCYGVISIILNFIELMNFSFK